MMPSGHAPSASIRGRIAGLFGTGLTMLFAVACGLCVANVCFAQPLIEPFSSLVTAAVCATEFRRRAALAATSGGARADRGRGSAQQRGARPGVADQASSSADEGARPRRRRSHRCDDGAAIERLQGVCRRDRGAAQVTRWSQRSSPVRMAGGARPAGVQQGGMVSGSRWAAPTEAWMMPKEPRKMWPHLDAISIYKRLDVAISGHYWQHATDVENTLGAPSLCSGKSTSGPSLF